MRSHFLAAGVAAMVCLCAHPAVAQQVTKETVPGITNFARLETTVACAGTLKSDAIPELKKMGFVSIINLRPANEPGADVETEGAAAKAAGLLYIHIPFNGASPDPAVADHFLKAITTKGTEPAFIHCASGNRAAAMWLIKRLVIDHWDVDRATKEATALGLSSAPLTKFALDYAGAHRQ